MDRIKTKWKSRPYVLQRVVFLLAIFALLASVTYLAFNVFQNNTTVAKSRLDSATTDGVRQLSYRIETYTDMLYSERALLEIKPSVTSQEWSTFVEGQKIRERYPGVYGVGYVRMEGGQHAILRYLSTTDSSYQNVLGYDMYSDATRKFVLEKARDTGLAQATPPLSLKTDKPNDPPSIIIVLPVYDASLSVDSVSDRRNALTGYVVVGLHSKPLLDSIFASGTLFADINSTITTDSQKLYEHGKKPTAGYIEKTVEIDIAGQTWTVVFKAPKTFGISRTGTLGPELVIAIGLAFAVSLVLIFWYSIRLKDLKYRAGDYTV